MFLGKLGCLSVGVGSSYLAQIGVKDREGRKGHGAMGRGGR